MIPIRDDQPRFSTPYVTYFLIGLNLVDLPVRGDASRRRTSKLFSFNWEWCPPTSRAFLAGASRMGLMAAFLPTLTSMFLHGSWMHVIGNMWFLWIFGDNIEDHLGHFKYLLFYLLSGLGAAFAQVVLNPHSRRPDGRRQRRDRRRSGRILPALSTGESVDLVPDSVSLLSAGLGHAGLLVRHAICERSRHLNRELQRNPRRGGVLGPCGRLSRGHHPDQALSRASATLSLWNLVTRTSDRQTSSQTPSPAALRVASTAKRWAVRRSWVSRLMARPVAENRMLAIGSTTQL